MHFLVIPVCILTLVGLVCLQDGPTAQGDRGAEEERAAHNLSVDATSLWRWNSAKLTSLEQLEPASVVVESISIRVGLDIVPMRVTVTPFVVEAVLTRDQRDTDWAGTVWLYEATDLRANGRLEWRIACHWSDCDLKLRDAPPGPAPALVRMDADTQGGYFVISIARHSWIVPIQPVPEALSVEQAVENWFTLDIENDQMLLNLPIALKKAGVLYSFIERAPGPMSALTDTFQQLEFTSVSRADDGTWFIGLSSPYRDYELMLIGQGEQWRAAYQEVSWGSFQLTSEHSWGVRVVSDKASIPVGAANVDFRLTTKLLMGEGVLANEQRQRQWVGMVRVYEATDLRQSGELGWCFATSWAWATGPRVLVDDEAGVAYLIAMQDNDLLIVPLVPVREPLGVQHALENWFTRRLPEGALLMDLTEALDSAGVLYSFVKEIPRPHPTTPRPWEELEFTSVARAEDGTWSIGLSWPQWDKSILLVGQGEQWRAVEHH